MNAPSRTKTICAAIPERTAKEILLRKYTHGRHPLCDLWIVYDPEGHVVVGFPREIEASGTAQSFNECLSRHGGLA